MRRLNWMIVAALAALMGMGGTGAARTDAAAIPHRHITGPLRVDGTSDLRGKVQASSGLRVSAGLTTDSLSASGPAHVGGILTVAGAVQLASSLTVTGAISAAGLSATGSVQGGSLSVGSDAVVGGNLSVGKRLAATSGDIGQDLHVAGTLQSGAVAVNGGITSGGTVTASAISASAATVSQLVVPSSGSVNFNNAPVSGLNLANVALTSLQIASPSTGGTPALIITQSGQTAGLSVSPSGALAVSGTGLSATGLSLSGDASIGGALNTSRITSPSGLTLTAPRVATTGQLVAGGDLRLDIGGSVPHLIGNRDTRGQCTTSGLIGATSVCTVVFTSPYATPPIVVVTPTSVDPGVVIGYSVQTNTTGFTISFRATAPATVTFNYMVEG